MIEVTRTVFACCLQARTRDADICESKSSSNPSIKRTSQSWLRHL